VGGGELQPAKTILVLKYSSGDFREYFVSVQIYVPVQCHVLAIILMYMQGSTIVNLNCPVLTLAVNDVICIRILLRVGGDAGVGRLLVAKTNLNV
jgi:hypothetical protein